MTDTERPFLFTFVGSVVGVGFEPGTSEVRIKPEEGESILRLIASADLVERALELRGNTVNGLAVKGKDSRLLRLSAADSSQFVLTPTLHKKYVFERWEGVLRRLA